MKMRKIIVICMAMVIALSGFTFVSAAEKTIDVNDYKATVTLDDSEFSGVRIELMTRDGKHIKSWELAEKGKLTADLPPGSYTLREIIEINGYEFPNFTNFMVGCGNLVPVDPNAPDVSPEWPEILPEVLPEVDPVFPDLFPELFPEYV
ncbi:MAG: hypothetical protein J6M22_02540 [Firmicutes bacterium]|nr:hypothetical protein [Bacillota bacterium]